MDNKRMRPAHTQWACATPLSATAFNCFFFILWYLDNTSWPVIFYCQSYAILTSDIFYHWSFEVENIYCWGGLSKYVHRPRHPRVLTSECDIIWCDKKHRAFATNTLSAHLSVDEIFTQYA
jgi:hypothetical protein